MASTRCNEEFEYNTDSMSSFFNHNAEGYHTLMFLFSDRNTPVSYRYADIFSVNTYKFTKPVGAKL
jgi:catalase